jgi:branched-chain amino acid transport system ATP-binding protein
VTEPILRLSDVEVHYGGIRALEGISLDVAQGEIVAVIGANGAGKTTTLRAVTGLVRPTKGGIVFAGRSLVGAATHETAHRGISMVPEGRAIFANLTVRENLELGAWVHKDRARIRNGLEHVFALFPRLKERIAQEGGTLSGGEQQMLAIGRAMMAEPKLLLLDEPSLGLAPRLVAEVFDAVRRINSEGTTVLLVEQNTRIALTVAARGYVIETGRVALSGPAAELREDPRVKEAYLGEGTASA